MKEKNIKRGNIIMSYEIVKNFRQRLKERATYVMGNKCACCGYDKCIQALEFHHLNPEEKDFNFGTNTNRSWESTRNEIKKCILVCANCHREIHYGLIDSSLLQSSFNEQRAEEIDKLVNDVKVHKIYYCRSCGKEVWRGNEYCPECAAKARRKVERPNREELKMLIRNNSFMSLGRKYGVTDNTIRKWCKAENLPFKSTEIKQYTDNEWELI